MLGLARFQQKIGINLTSAQLSSEMGTVGGLRVALLMFWRESKMAACQVRSARPDRAVFEFTSNGLLEDLYHHDDYMVYPRPASLPRPAVWRRFTVLKGGAPRALRIQDLTQDMFPEALDLLGMHFTKDEPPCKYIEIQKHPGAVAELKKLWSTAMEDQLSLACVTDDAISELVAVNVLTVAKKEDKDEPFHTEDETWAMLFGAVDLVSRGVDIFEHYQVDKYLTAYGLVVDPVWRGLNIGRVMLEARIPLCKALGIKVTATVFTAGASQALARKAGFQVLFEITYEDLAKKGFVFPGVEKDTKSSKLMALVIE